MWQPWGRRPQPGADRTHADPQQEGRLRGTPRGTRPDRHRRRRPGGRRRRPDGRFPRDGIDALRQAGLLALPVSAEHGGGGARPPGGLGGRAAPGQACGSTAMVVMMHYAAVAAHRGATGREDVRRRSLPRQAPEHPRVLRVRLAQPLLGAARARPPPTATTSCLDARKSWVTSAGEADSYVWSSRPLAADGPDDPVAGAVATPPGLTSAGGLRRPRAARQRLRPGRRPTACVVPADAMLGATAPGSTSRSPPSCPWFLVLNAAFSLGPHGGGDRRDDRRTSPARRLEHLDQTLAQQHVGPRSTSPACGSTPTARARCSTTRSPPSRRSGPTPCCASSRSRRPPPRPRSTVTDLAMKVCGGAAFRKELGIERRFRDAARGPGHGADHRRPARLRRPGAAAACRCWTAPRDDRRRPPARGGRLRPQGRHHLGRLPRPGSREQDLDFDYVLYSNYERQVEDLRRGSHPRRLELAAGLGPGATAGRAPRASPCEAVVMRDTDRDLTSVVVVRADSGDRLGRADLRGRGSWPSAPSTRPRPRCCPGAPACRRPRAARRRAGAPLRRRRRPARRPHRRRARRGPARWSRARSTPPA